MTVEGGCALLMCLADRAADAGAPSRWRLGKRADAAVWSEGGWPTLPLVGVFKTRRSLVRQPGQLSRDRIVVSTSRCGRDNPGSNPGHGSSPSFAHPKKKKKEKK